MPSVPSIWLYQNNNLEQSSIQQLNGREVMI